MLIGRVCGRLRLRGMLGLLKARFRSWGGWLERRLV